MNISTRAVEGVLVVDMEGRLDSHTAGYGNDEMVRIVKGDHKDVLINLAKLEFITSAGLRVLLLAAKLLQTSGGKLKLCAANQFVKDVLETSGFTSLIALYATEADAVGAFS
ncbi:MAG: STAS domain-containing protein [Pseudomonadota bacterium]